MKAALIGAGKMGFPVSLAHCLIGGHEIYAYDINPKIREAIRHPETYLTHEYYYEPDIKARARRALDTGRYHVVNSVHEAIRPDWGKVDIILVAVPTPSLADNTFDNSYIVAAMEEIGKFITSGQIVVIISTVLPGTTRNVILPTLEKASMMKVGQDIGLDYSASFIAMGTCYEDAITPEFILIGASDNNTAAKVMDYYDPIVNSQESVLEYQRVYGSLRNSTPMLKMTYEEAEFTKNLYNVYIGAKIVIANASMELSQKLGHINSDVVSNAIGRANVRIMGTKYLRGGMGDGGVCHGRDALALSAVAKKFNLSADPFDYIMQARSAQADWMAKFLAQYRMPIVIMGERYKPNTNITEFSPSKLVAGFLDYYKASYTFFDPVVGKNHMHFGHPTVYLVALNEPFVREFNAEKGFHTGDIVVDAWRMFSDAEVAEMRARGVNYVPLGNSRSEVDGATPS